MVYILAIYQHPELYNLDPIFEVKLHNRKVYLEIKGDFIYIYEQHSRLRPPEYFRTEKYEGVEKFLTNSNPLLRKLVRTFLNKEKLNYPQLEQLLLERIPVIYQPNNVTYLVKLPPRRIEHASV